MSPRLVPLALAAAFVAQPALAQQAQSQAASSPFSSFGGLSGLAAGVLPNVGSAGLGNTAGVLGYCVKNNVLGGANASSILGRLTGQSGVADSKGYALGQSGQLQTGNGRAFSLDALKGQMKTKVCDLVLNHAKSFAGIR